MEGLDDGEGFGDLVGPLGPNQSGCLEEKRICGGFVTGVYWNLLLLEDDGAGVIGKGDFMVFCSMFIRSGAKTLFLAPPDDLGDLGDNCEGAAMFKAFSTECGSGWVLALTFGSFGDDFSLFNILSTLALRSAPLGFIGAGALVVVVGVVCKVCEPLELAGMFNIFKTSCGITSGSMDGSTTGFRLIPLLALYLMGPELEFGDLMLDRSTDRPPFGPVNESI